MKQAVDKFTGDMFEQAHEAQTKKPKAKYRVYLTTTEGAVLVWTHLSELQAKAMYKMLCTKFNVLQSSTEVTRIGCEEML